MRISVASPTLVATFTKKNCILVIFGKFKKRNPRAVGFFRRILDRNVVVHHVSFNSCETLPSNTLHHKDNLIHVRFNVDCNALHVI